MTIHPFIQNVNHEEKRNPDLKACTRAISRRCKMERQLHCFVLAPHYHSSGHSHLSIITGHRHYPHHRSSTLSSLSSSSRLLSLWVHHCLLGGTLWCASVWPLHATWWECMAPNQVPAFKSTLVLNFSQLNSVMYGKKIFSSGANLNRTSFSFFDWCAIFGICLLKA